MVVNHVWEIARPFVLVLWPIIVAFFICITINMIGNMGWNAGYVRGRLDERLSAPEHPNAGPGSETFPQFIWRCAFRWKPL